MCGSLLPPARNTPSTGNPANVLQQVSNLASLASVARGGCVRPTTPRSLFFFHASSMSPCTATIKVSGFLGGASGLRGPCAAHTEILGSTISGYCDTWRIRIPDCPGICCRWPFYLPGSDPSQNSCALTFLPASSKSPLFLWRPFYNDTVLSSCDLAYSFDSLRRYSDQLGLEPRTSNESCPGRCSIHLKLKTRDFQLRPCSISKNLMVPGLEPGKSHEVGTTFTPPSNS